MITDLGHIAVILALAACLYAALISVLGAKRNDDRPVQSGRIAAAMTFPLVLLGALGSWYALITKDYSIKYVADVSNNGTPLFYRITALWGSQNGSMLFWNLIMSAFIAAVMARRWEADKSLLPYVTATSALVLAFFLSANILLVNPFARLDFPPPDGRGLNPLLRHFGMIIHPPMLYAGFTGLLIPFAFCAASLITRRRDNLWLRSSRRWTLLGWAFLAAGLILGGRWAHDVLGWGGYWGWDPVENKSLIPWLFATAFLHSAMIQEKRGMFKNWNVALLMLMFASMIWGTAVVRSGILTSVHAFAQSPLGPYFLGFIIVVLAASAYLWFSRLDILRSDHKLDSWFSREGMFLLQNVIFASSALSVFIGTTFPIFTEAIDGTKITVGPPWYNQVVVPQFVVLVVLMGIAPLVAWGKASAGALGRMALGSLFFAGVVMIILFAAGVRQLLPLLLFGLCAYTLGQTILEYVRGVRARMRSVNENIGQAMLHLVTRNQRRYGGYLVHIGVVLFAIGAIGKGFYGADTIRTIALNETTTFGNYAFTYRGVYPRICDFGDCATMEARVLVTTADGRIVGGVFPYRDVYDVQVLTYTAAGVTGSFNEEVYVVMAGWHDGGQSATFQIYINPLINWVWVGGIVMILGFFVAFWKMGPEEAGEHRAVAARPALAGAPSK